MRRANIAEHRRSRMAMSCDGKGRFGAVSARTGPLLQGPPATRPSGTCRKRGDLLRGGCRAALLVLSWRSAISLIVQQEFSGGSYGSKTVPHRLARPGRNGGGNHHHQAGKRPGRHRQSGQWHSRRTGCIRARSDARSDGCRSPARTSPSSRSSPPAASSAQGLAARLPSRPRAWPLAAALLARARLDLGVIPMTACGREAARAGRGRYFSKRAPSGVG